MVEEKLLVARWDGGNDSGWVEILDSDFEEYSDLMYETLDYGSWAGDFESRGEIFHDAKNNTLVFQGEEYDSSNMRVIKEDTFVLELPEDLYIDGVAVGMSSWESNRFEVLVDNGIISPEAKSFEQNATRKLNEAIKVFTSDNQFVENLAYFNRRYEYGEFSKIEIPLILHVANRIPINKTAKL